MPAELRVALTALTKESSLAWMSGRLIAVSDAGADDTDGMGALSSGTDEAQTTADVSAYPEADVWVVATRQNLVVIPQPDTASNRAAESTTNTGPSLSVEPCVTPWWLVDRAGWDPTTDQLRVSFTTGTDPLRVQVAGKTPVRFLTLLRDRVENSVVISETVPLGTGDNVRVAVRRTPDQGLVVQAIGDPGIDVNHPEVSRRIRPVMEKLAEVSGAA